MKNRAAFQDRPDVYIPSFGGYDVLAIGRGAAVPARPQYWLVIDQRLYLFESPAARDAFAAEPGKALAAAQTRWPELLKTLAP
jgi:hypothetical protein